MHSYPPGSPHKTPLRPRAGKPLQHRARRLKRQGHKAYIRSVYLLPSLATLGNLVSGFAAIYVASLTLGVAYNDPVTAFLSRHGVVAACYLLGLAMLFDAIDGSLARMARHSTDFGGQLDSLADTVSFGVAPAYIALMTYRADAPELLPLIVTRLVWATAAVYVSCTAIRLARFNVANQHGVEHHMSFLGLPSPAAAGVICSFILAQQEVLLHADEFDSAFFGGLGTTMTLLLPVLLVGIGLLMVSTFRYAHLINRYLSGRRSVPTLIVTGCIVLGLIVAHQYTFAIGTLWYALGGIVMWGFARLRRAMLRPDRPQIT